MQIRRAAFPRDLAVVDALLAAVAAADGYLLSEDAALDLHSGAPRGYLAEEAGHPVGYAHLRAAPGGTTIEAVLPPEHRGRLTPGLLEAALGAAGGGAVVWSADPVVAKAAAGLGLVEVRRVLQLERALPAPPVGLPPGLEVGRFDLDADLDAFLEVNNAAFAGHPENGGWTRAAVRERIGRAWFDPDGVFLAREYGRVVGACWTKLHPEGVGEIYVLAVHPEVQGRGVGRALVLWGLDYLAGRTGAIRGMVFTEGDNYRGRRLYGSLGFEVGRVLRCWGPERSAGIGAGS